MTNDRMRISQRLERIRQLRADAEWVQDCIDMSGIVEPERGIPQMRRILALLKSTLEEVKKQVA